MILINFKRIPDVKGAPCQRIKKYSRYKRPRVSWIEHTHEWGSFPFTVKCPVNNMYLAVEYVNTHPNYKG